jgi:hypothetical protein
MPGSKPGERRGGRQKGTPNKVGAEIKALAGQHTPAALKTLVSVMQSSTSDAARVAAAKELLDRGHGKATQPVSGADGGPLIVEIVKYAAS